MNCSRSLKSFKDIYSFLWSWKVETFFKEKQVTIFFRCTCNHWLLYNCVALLFFQVFFSTTNAIGSPLCYFLRVLRVVLKAFNCCIASCAQETSENYNKKLFKDQTQWRLLNTSWWFSVFFQEKLLKVVYANFCYFFWFPFKLSLFVNL